MDVLKGYGICIKGAREENTKKIIFFVNFKGSFVLVSDHKGLLPINSIAIIVGEVQFPCSSKSWFVVGKAGVRHSLDIQT
jgi:hypothetical protein